MRELLILEFQFWYCKEYASRLGLDETGSNYQYDLDCSQLANDMNVETCICVNAFYQSASQYGGAASSNQSKPPLEFPVVKSGGATSVSLGKSEIEMSSRKNRIANLSNDQIVQKGKAFSEMTEILGTDEEEDEDVEDSIVSGFVGTGRIKTDVTRKPCLNTVSEQNGSDQR